ncbi:MAG: apolipoprotein N-acyltransferase [Candidatus Hydrogenedens sp.]|nr:apolipoprotein N-acyltransferase [Candidatus Hydrogenedens sp.]
MKKTFLHSLWPALSALLLCWAFPRFHFYPLGWIALVPLLAYTREGTIKKTLLAFFICGWLFHTLLLQWLWANMFWAGGWAVFGQQLLCFILSLFWLLPAVAWHYFRASQERYTAALGLACLWVGMELLQARLFTGFGWAALGYSQGADLALAQLASLGGVSLISFALVFVNGLIALAWSGKKHRWWRVALVPLFIALLHLGGFFMLQEADYESQPFNAGIIQPNFSQEMKWDSEYYTEMLQKTGILTQSLAAHKAVDLVVWPEAVVTVDYKIPLFHNALSDIAVAAESYIFTGAVREDSTTGKSYNSSVLFTPEGREAGYYDKMRLAAFGEYIPFESYLPFIGRIAFSGISPGEEQKIFSVKDRKLAPLICFEVLFGSMAEELRQKGADILVVVTNLAWFGNTSAIPQELEIARMRAIETGLPLLHSANTGVSGTFDPYGRFYTVHHTVDPRGALLDWTEKTKPNQVVMRRFVDAFPVAAPARRLLPMGPALLPWFLFALGILLALWTVFKNSALFAELEGVEEKEPAKPRKKAAAKKAAAKKAAKAPAKEKTAAKKKSTAKKSEDK